MLDCNIFSMKILPISLTWQLDFKFGTRIAIFSRSQFEVQNLTGFIICCFFDIEVSRIKYLQLKQHQCEKNHEYLANRRNNSIKIVAVYCQLGYLPNESQTHLSVQLSRLQIHLRYVCQNQVEV